jgi:anti-anti-sigma factor
MGEKTHTNAWASVHDPPESHDRDGKQVSPLATRQTPPRPCLLVRPHGNVKIVEFLNAQMLFEDRDVEELGASLLRLARDGHVRILLNLQGVEYASSALIGSIAWLHHRVTSAGGLLRLYSLEPVLREALRICSLDRTLEIYNDESAALAGSDSA